MSRDHEPPPRWIPGAHHLLNPRPELGEDPRPNRGGHPSLTAAGFIQVTQSLVSLVAALYVLSAAGGYARGDTTTSTGDALGQGFAGLAVGLAVCALVGAGVMAALAFAAAAGSDWARIGSAVTQLMFAVAWLSVVARTSHALDNPDVVVWFEVGLGFLGSCSLVALLWLLPSSRNACRDES